jgi:hypothetical protein
VEWSPSKVAGLQPAGDIDGAANAIRLTLTINGPTQFVYTTATGSKSHSIKRLVLPKSEPQLGASLGRLFDSPQHVAQTVG